MADPELYIIVNNKRNVVWRNLVDVHSVKEAVRKLRECNWLYWGVVCQVASEAGAVRSGHGSTPAVLDSSSTNLSWGNFLWWPVDAIQSWRGRDGEREREKVECDYKIRT